MIHSHSSLQKERKVQIYLLKRARELLTFLSLCKKWAIRTRNQRANSQPCKMFTKFSTKLLKFSRHKLHNIDPLNRSTWIRAIGTGWAGPTEQVPRSRCPTLASGKKPSLSLPLSSEVSEDKKWLGAFAGKTERSGRILSPPPSCRLYRLLLSRNLPFSHTRTTAPLHHRTQQ